MQEFLFLKMLVFFIENPYEDFYLRQLSKKLNLSTFAVKKYADILLNNDLIKEERKANLRYFKANITSLFFKQLKIAFNLHLITKAGFIDFLKENLTNVSSIVLFGSVAKGEDDKKSDMDVLVIGLPKHLRLLKLEEKINKEINLHIFSWSEWNEKAKGDKAFYFEVISHGVPLYGELPIVKWK